MKPMVGKNPDGMPIFNFGGWLYAEPRRDACAYDIFDGRIVLADALCNREQKPIDSVSYPELRAKGISLSQYMQERER